MCFCISVVVSPAFLVNLPDLIGCFPRQLVKTTTIQKSSECNVAAFDLATGTGAEGRENIVRGRRSLS